MYGGTFVVGILVGVLILLLYIEYPLFGRSSLEEIRLLAVNEGPQVCISTEILRPPRVLRTDGATVYIKVGGIYGGEKILNDLGNVYYIDDGEKTSVWAEFEGSQRGTIVDNTDSKKVLYETHLGHEFFTESYKYDCASLSLAEYELDVSAGVRLFDLSEITRNGREGLEQQCATVESEDAEIQKCVDTFEPLLEL